MGDFVVDGFFCFALAIGKLLIELVCDLRDVVRECSWPDAHADEERLARLRRWDERVQRSLQMPTPMRFRA
jgi:hypothetical protein